MHDALKNKIKKFNHFFIFAQHVMFNSNGKLNFIYHIYKLHKITKLKNAHIFLDIAIVYLPTQITELININSWAWKLNK